MNLTRKKLLPILLLFILSISGCSKSENTEELVEIPKPEEPIISAILDYKITGENSLNFENVVQNFNKTIPVVFSNSGNSDLTMSSILLPEPFSSDFDRTILKPNDSLTVLISFNPTEIITYEGTLEIESDATNSINTIPLFGNGVSATYEGSISLLTQEQVEDFAVLGYTKIAGVLFIGNLIGTTSVITSLEELSVLTEIGSLDVSNTVGLENLDGLENIIINQSIQIGRNKNLQNLNALSHLTVIENFVNIFGNEVLNDLSGMSNITEIKNDLWIRENDALTSIEAFSNLTTIGDGFRLVDNIAIESLNGLDNLLSLKGSFTVINNPKLFNYCSIQPLLNSSDFTGVFSRTSYNRYNPSSSLIRGGACANEIPLGTYQGDLSLESDNQIISFILRGYSIFDGTLNIYGDRAFSEAVKPSTLELLNGLTIVTGRLIVQNTTIKNLKGLENLVSVQNLIIRNNAYLDDFCDITLTAQNGGLQNYTAEGNLFNPTLEILQNGACSQ